MMVHLTSIWPLEFESLPGPGMQPAKKELAVDSVPHSSQSSIVFFWGGNFRYICLDVWTGLSSCMFFKDRDGIRMTPLVNFQRSKYAFATLRTIAPAMCFEG